MSILRIWPQWNETLAHEVRLLSSLVLQGARLCVVDGEDAS